MYTYLPRVLVFSLLIITWSVGSCSLSTFSDSAALRYSVKPWYKVRPEGGAGREVIVYFDQVKPVGKIKMELSWEKDIELSEYEIKPGQDSLSVLLPPGVGLEACKVQMNFRSDQLNIQQTLNIPLKKQWTVFIYPHSHVDIGYTNTQEIVKKLHVRNIDVGIDIAEKTSNYYIYLVFDVNSAAPKIVAIKNPFSLDMLYLEPTHFKVRGVSE